MSYACHHLERRPLLHEHLDHAPYTLHNFLSTFEGLQMMCYFSLNSAAFSSLGSDAWVLGRRKIPSMAPVVSLQVGRLATWYTEGRGVDGDGRESSLRNVMLCYLCNFLVKTETIALRKVGFLDIQNESFHTKNHILVPLHPHQPVFSLSLLPFSRLEASGEWLSLSPGTSSPAALPSSCGCRGTPAAEVG